MRLVIVLVCRGEGVKLQVGGVEPHPRQQAREFLLCSLILGEPSQEEAQALFTHSIHIGI